MEVIAANELGTQWPGFVVPEVATNPIGIGGSLERGDVFKFGCRSGEALVKLVGEQAPVVFLPSLDAALLRVADAIKPFRPGVRLQVGREEAFSSPVRNRNSRDSPLLTPTQGRRFDSGAC